MLKIFYNKKVDLIPLKFCISKDPCLIEGSLLKKTPLNRKHGLETARIMLIHDPFPFYSNQIKSINIFSAVKINHNIQ